MTILQLEHFNKFGDDIINNGSVTSRVCEKTYPRLKTLKDHMRIHTNDRRYRCHICGQAFIQNCSLKAHLKSQHPEYG
ncbi:unnamed protein product [Plutella xylostella]|uniref:(diamondback moth) hypothetical protein n=1 Tax=Plutella xylostella TaxID=51655 RepID=A0A8S4DYZ7_PLUXY|nr:unnamed protein product [Plutella xylostella]